MADKQFVRTIIQIICLSLFTALFSGCSIGSSHYFLTGNNEAKQSDHVVSLVVSSEPKTFGQGYTPRPFGNAPANCFVFSIKSDKKPQILESVRGNYQYYSENPEPLEVIWIGQGEALLIPTADIVSTPSPKRTEKTGEMKHGQYKLDIMYRLNGNNYECHFDVNYTMKTDFHAHGFWELRDVN